MTTKPPPYELLPSVDRLLRLQQVRPSVPPELAKEAARSLVSEIRRRMRASWPPEGGTTSVLSEDALRARLEEIRAELTQPFHARVINATGILLHTGLGRAPLPAAAIRAIQEVAGQGYVEVEPDSGRRGRRETTIAAHLCAVTGAAAATAVNNNAAATLLALDAMARGRGVVVSRGELVEIGGGFRMPDVMRQAGCKLVEVGTTNRTKPSDYVEAIGEDTACLLKVHPSNYRIEGFHEEVSLEQLVAIGRERGLPVVEDLGSGYLLDEPLPHDSREPSVPGSVRSGADLIWFSGDKLLGACQAGILVGSEEWIAAVSSHPLYRALRLDKLALAALEAALLIYRFGRPKEEIPVLRAVFTPVAELEQQAESIVAEAAAAASDLGFEGRVEPARAYLGSGASPARAIESRAVRLRPTREGADVEELARRLRTGRPAVFPRIEDGGVLLDLRSLGPGEWKEVAAVLIEIAAETEEGSGWHSGRRTIV